MGARRWRRWTDGAGIGAAARRTAARKTGPTRRWRASPPDCLEEEEEEKEAELLPRLDLFLVAGVDGDVRRRTVSARPWRRAVLGLAAGGERRGEEAGGRGVLSYPPGGPGRRGGGNGGQGATAASGGSVSPGATVKGGR